MKKKFITLLLLIILMQVVFIPVPNNVYAATSPSLGQAASFSVLAGLSMSAAAAGTIIPGDLGLSPGLEVSRTGTWTVGGLEYFGTGGLSAGAQTDALSAYNNLAGQDSNGSWAASPWSPVPGVWTVASDTTFTGTITLNGSYNDVWIFRVGRDMTFSGSVVLAGNTQPCHVFWQIGRSATIASGSKFIGTLIASTGSVTLVSGAAVNGRILVLKASLTTDGNTITGPTCDAAPTSTPTPTPTPTPTSTLTPTPTPTPTPIPTSTSSVTNSASSSNSSGASCIASEITVVASVIIESRRIDADSIFISWGPYSGTNTFNVEYGTENGKWLYNTDVTGFSTTINALPTNQPIWVRVAARNNCAIGSYGEAKLVGGPGLPNTGFAPREQSVPGYIPISIFAGISVLFVLIQRKHGFSSGNEKKL
jgi:hypothetical protein